MTKCHDCPVPIPNGMQVIRSIRLQRVTLCTSCAEDRGWIDPNMRQASEVRGSMARMMSRMLVTVALVAAAFTFAGSASATSPTMSECSPTSLQWCPVVMEACSPTTCQPPAPGCTPTTCAPTSKVYKQKTRRHHRR